MTPCGDSTDGEPFLTGDRARNVLDHTDHRTG